MMYFYCDKRGQEALFKIFGCVLKATACFCSLKIRKLGLKTTIPSVGNSQGDKPLVVSSIDTATKENLQRKTMRQAGISLKHGCMIRGLDGG